jgi:hypothetical protein
MPMRTRTSASLRRSSPVRFVHVPSTRWPRRNVERTQHATPCVRQPRQLPRYEVERAKPIDHIVKDDDNAITFAKTRQAPAPTAPPPLLFFTLPLHQQCPDDRLLPPPPPPPPPPLPSIPPSCRPVNDVSPQTCRYPACKGKPGQCAGVYVMPNQYSPTREARVALQVGSDENGQEEKGSCRQLHTR